MVENIKDLYVGGKSIILKNFRNLIFKGKNNYANILAITLGQILCRVFYEHITVNPHTNLGDRLF